MEQPLPERLSSQAAMAHDRDGKRLAGRWHTYPEKAAAGLWTRPLDLARVAIAVQKAAAGDTKFLPAALTREMLNQGPGEYGLGWGVGGKDDDRRFGHGGANAGYRCNLSAYLKRGQAAVVMTNSDNGAVLAQEILRSIAAEYGWPDHRVQEKRAISLTREQLAAYAGGTALKVPR
jgi:hypothetical protein